MLMVVLKVIGGIILSLILTWVITHLIYKLQKWAGLTDEEIEEGARQYLLNKPPYE